MQDLTPVSYLMTPEVITLNPLDTFDKIHEIFTKYNIHHVPIVDEYKKVVGIISKHDYYALSDQLTMISKDSRDGVNKSFFASLLTQEVMRKSPICLFADAVVAKAIDIFKENRFHAIPVINNHKELVGILSTLDVMNYLSAKLEGKSCLASPCSITCNKPQD